MKYRKKPVVIEALQAAYGYKNLDEIIAFAGSALAPIERRPDYKLKINTLEGILIIEPGDYIIKGIKNEFYPCKPDIFEATYEKVN